MNLKNLSIEWEYEEVLQIARLNFPKANADFIYDMFGFIGNDVELIRASDCEKFFGKLEWVKVDIDELARKEESYVLYQFKLENQEEIFSVESKNVEDTSIEWKYYLEDVLGKKWRIMRMD